MDDIVGEDEFDTDLSRGKIRCLTAVAGGRYDDIALVTGAEPSIEQ